MGKLKKANRQLQRERELHGWSQAKVAEKIGTTVKRVSMWECGDAAPGRYYQELLIQLFGKNAQELGFLNDGDMSENEKMRLDNFYNQQHGTEANTILETSNIFPVIPELTPTTNNAMTGRLLSRNVNSQYVWTDNPHEVLTTYLKHQQDHILNALAPGSTNLRVRDVVGHDGLFISPPWELRHGTSESSNLVDYLVEMLTMHQRILLLGDAGQGKTTLLKHVFTFMSDRFIKDIENRVPFPLYIPLRQFPSLAGNAFDLLWTHIVDEFPLSFDEFTLLIRNNQIVFLFDGFDEITGELTQRAINERAASKIFSRSSILTCRRSFFEFYLSMSLLREYYHHWIELQPLTLSQPVIQYISTFCERKQQNMNQKEYMVQPEMIIEFIRSSQQLQDLAQRPFLLIMMLDIFTDPKAMSETNWNTTRLYRKYTEKWLKNEASKQASLLKWHEKGILLRELSWFMYHTKSPAHTLYRLNQDTVFTLSDLLNFVQTIAPRYPHLTEAQLLDDICFCTLLAISEGETFVFLHKSFQEYYVARYIFERFCDKERSTDIVKVVSSVLQEFLPFEIVTFLKEMLISKELTAKERNQVIENLIRVYQHNNGDDLRSATIRQHASHYLACVGTQPAMQFLETACDQESNKWVQRGIVVGLALYCERADMLERYIKTLREDTEASSINIGYHLVYYGDQAQEQGYYDHGSEQIDGTIQALFRRLQNKRYQNGWLLDLYTLATLLEQRGVAILKPYKSQLAFLREFLGRDNQHQSTIFQQEKRRLEDILQETILWT